MIQYVVALCLRRGPCSHTTRYYQVWSEGVQKNGTACIAEKLELVPPL